MPGWGRRGRKEDRRLVQEDGQDEKLKGGGKVLYFLSPGILIEGIHRKGVKVRS